MPGGITYDGVPSATGGQIFDGLRFWVAQRVPMRSSIIDQINNNSGTVVLQESAADYLIADHVRKDAPSGSISWKFIADSVEHGAVQILDRYAISHAPAGPRQASSSRPTKGTRASFTDEEDAELARWVLAHDKDRTGNEIYKQFELTHPSHPWQSWRNRFAKRLMLMPPDALIALAARATDSARETEEATAKELPDPTELMLQRKGERVQSERAQQRALQRAEQRSTEPAAAAQAAPQPQEQPQPQSQENTPRDDDEDNTTAKNQFYEDLQWYSEENGIEIAPTQQVAGQPVELWELSKAVSEQRLPAEEIDWLRVAEDLGYKWPDVDAAVRSLQSCYEDNLSEFLQVMQDALEDQLDDEAAEAAGDVNTSPRAHVPSSPPARFLPPKRARESDEDFDTPVPAKRRRLHIPPAIPSTPNSQRLPNTARRSVVAGTPVQFETQVPNLQAHESSFDMTPSQQLQSEHFSSSPVPLRLNNTAQNHQAGEGSSRQGSSKVKRRVLPSSFHSQNSSTEQGQDEGSMFVQQSYDAHPFPGALLSAQPAPQQPIGRPAQVVAATRRRSKHEELGELIQHYESFGYSHKTVVEGLRRTTMTPGLATVVMESMQKGEGVPTNVEGVWTDRDDTGLRLVDGTDLERESKDRDEMRKIRKARKTRDRLLAKHGEERMVLRMKFLKANDSLAYGERG